MTKIERIDLHYLALAFVTAQRSKDPSTKVGAIIVGVDGRSISSGYNGMVAGSPETEKNWNNRVLKYPRVIHAELNAILNCPFSRNGATLYCTLHPCAQCLKAALQSGITRIVYYGAPWERETERDVINELKHMVAWTQYNNDPVIDGLRVLYSNGS